MDPDLVLLLPDLGGTSLAELLAADPADDDVLAHSLRRVLDGVGVGNQACGTDDPTVAAFNSHI